MNEFEWEEESEPEEAWNEGTVPLQSEELVELVRNMVAELRSSPELEESVRWLAGADLAEEEPLEAEIWGALASAAIAALPALVKAAPGIVRAVKGLAGSRRRGSRRPVRRRAIRPAPSSPAGRTSASPAPASCPPASGGSTVSRDLAAAAAALVPVLMSQLKGTKGAGEAIEGEPEGFHDQDELWWEGEYRWTP